MTTSHYNVGVWALRIFVAPAVFYFIFAAASPADPARTDIVQVWIFGPRGAAKVACVDFSTG